MRAVIKKDPSLRTAAVRTLVGRSSRSGRFLRLSHLHKLREGEQVAAVCYRVRDGGIEFLLIRTRGSGRWTFPKGSSECGLTHAQAAALEAFEEAGVHGRIEERSFARYVSRKSGNGRKSATRSAENQVAVNAHLCEVLRLGRPKESNRNRTWFSAKDARRRLREGRESGDGAEFGRVVDKAAARIRRLSIQAAIEANRTETARQKDPLQKVQFEAFTEARGAAAFIPYVRRRLGQMGQPGTRDFAAQHQKVLLGDVLQFSPTEKKRVKALGSGSGNR